jgi:phage shock protein A
MAADDLGVVARFVVEVLEQGHLEVMDELVDRGSNAINWGELKDLLASIKDEYPGLGYHVGELDERDNGIAGTLHLSVPIAFHVANGRIDDLEVPEYLLPEVEEHPVQDRATGDESVGLETRLQTLRHAIDEAAVELAGNVERYGRIGRDLQEARQAQAYWEERAANARASGDSSEAETAQAHARVQRGLVDAYETERGEIGKLVKRLVNYLHTSEEKLLQFELKAEELAGKRRLAEAQESLGATIDGLTNIAERIASMEAQLQQAEAAAAQEAERARQTYERRLVFLRRVQEQGNQELDERLKTLMAEIEEAAPSSDAAPSPGTPT